MTKGEVMAFVRSVKPHELEDAVMLRWLEELEKKIACELHGRFARDEYKSLTAEQLSVPAPYDKLYWTYLVAMLELVQGTPESYAFANGVFKEAYADYARFLQRRIGFGRRRPLC